MKTTPFYELAMEIADSSFYQNHHFFICNKLNETDADFFSAIFNPHNGNCAWMCETNQSTKDAPNNPNNSNAHRIIALLFADLMWRDEHE